MFQIKIVEHSDVYYAPFIDKFFDRLEEAGLPPAEGPPATWRNWRRSTIRPAAPAAHAFDDGRPAAAAVAGWCPRWTGGPSTRLAVAASLRAAAARRRPLDEVTSPRQAETLTVQLDRRTPRVLAAIGAGAHRRLGVGTG